jgi:hypothetical protein
VYIGICDGIDTTKFSSLKIEKSWDLPTYIGVLTMIDLSSPLRTRPFDVWRFFLPE